MTSGVDRADLELLAAYDFTDRSEDDIRAEWIDPLLRQLGYGLGTRNDVLRGVSLELKKPIRMIGSRRIAIDYIPTVLNSRLWIIEAKRPQTDLFADMHLGQAWSYATDPRVAVPLMVLCDGKRLGVFDLTTENWPDPTLDIPNTEIATRFEELSSWLGASRVAERIRRLQLNHLRTALEAQVDLGVLDETAADVKQMVEEVRPVVQERRHAVRNTARARVIAAAQAELDTTGMHGFVLQVDEPWGPSRHDVDVATDIVMRSPRSSRVDEFDEIARATTPRGQTHSRMWFSTRALRLACAVRLSDTEGCAAHCEAAARFAARQHATGFAGEPVLQAAYRLQKALGRYGWRLAALARPQFEKEAARLARTLDAEEWLRLDGEQGITTDEIYMRVARFYPKEIQGRIAVWNEADLSSSAEEYRALLDAMDKPAEMQRFQPAGDPWYESWEAGDPLRSLSIALLRHIRDSSDSQRVGQLATELLADF